MPPTNQDKRPCPHYDRVHITICQFNWQVHASLLIYWADRSLSTPPAWGFVLAYPCLAPRTLGDSRLHFWHLVSIFRIPIFHLPATSLHFLASNLEFPDMIDFGMNLSWMLAAFGVDLFMYFQMFYIAFSWHIFECFLMHASNFVGSLLVRRTLADTYSSWMNIYIYRGMRVFTVLRKLFLFIKHMFETP